MQVIFKTVTFTLTAALVYLICSFYLAYHELHLIKPADATDFPEFSKIYWVPLISAFAFFAMKRQIQNITKPLFLQITKDKENTEVWLARIDRSSYYIFKFLFYLISSIWAYWLFYKTDCLPTWLGGTGDIKNLFEAFPFKK